MKKVFTANQFTPTHWSTGEDKAKFANHLIDFISSDFPKSKFPKWFYNRLSQCFGMIAHYNIEGFYQEYFTSRNDKIRFIRELLAYPRCGDPTYTYVDVETEVKKWIQAHKEVIVDFS